MQDKPSDIETFKVFSEEAGERLDAFLAKRDERHSRNRYKALIKAGHVSIDGKTLAEPNYRVNAGLTVSVAVPEPDDPTPLPEAIPLEIAFEDDQLIVINKEAGLVVHPAVGNWTGTLVNALLYHCGESLSGIGGVRRPGIVHRLDKDTSGLMVVAKTDAAHRGLSEQFADHGRSGQLVRSYDALVWGAPNPMQGTVSAALDRDRNNRLKRGVAKSGGKEAVTHYETVTRYKFKDDDLPVASHVRCQLETGRTHQIRVHMAHIKHPLLGDTVYGAGFLTKADSLPPHLAKSVKRFRRQALHAGVLGFEHPITGEALLFESEPPADMADLMKQFGASTKAP